jgi:hypothetical protein
VGYPAGVFYFKKHNEETIMRMFDIRDKAGSGNAGNSNSEADNFIGRNSDGESAQTELSFLRRPTTNTLIPHPQSQPTNLLNHANTQTRP